jgi:hypothetical protein
MGAGKTRCLARAKGAWRKKGSSGDGGPPSGRECQT